ncbi:MAG: hypothetical protein ACXABU_15950 [Candidatus Hodarchaeales archaeon]|jgi:hypothetical protein
MYDAYKQNISELTDIMNSGQLNRKKHWRIYQRALRYVRLNPQGEEDYRILNEVDSYFFEKWRVPKVKTSIGIPFLFLAVIFVQISYISLLTQGLEFIIGLLFFFTFSLVNFTLSHVIYHWIFGRVLGIRFKSVFVFKSSFRNAKFPFNLVGNLIPAFGIKYEVFSFLKADKWKRSLMFISAPPLTWVWFFVNYLLMLPIYTSESPILFLLGITLLISFLITQIASYYGKGDLWKASRDYK